MSTMNTIPATPSEFQSAAPANGNGLAAIETNEPAQSAGVSTGKAPTVANLHQLDDAARTKLGNDWADRCQEAGLKFKDIDARRDSYLLRAIAALALSIVFFPETNWAAKVNALGIGSANIKSKHRMAMAVVGTFGLNPYQEDSVEAKLDGQALGRNALATEWLVNYVTHLDDDEMATLTLDETGVDKLSQGLHAQGGIIVVGDLQRAANREAVAASRLRVSIDKKGAASIITERGERRLREQNGLAKDEPGSVGHRRQGRQRADGPYDPGRASCRHQGECLRGSRRRRSTCRHPWRDDEGQRHRPAQAGRRCGDRQSRDGRRFATVHPAC